MRNEYVNNVYLSGRIVAIHENAKYCKVELLQNYKDKTGEDKSHVIVVHFTPEQVKAFVSRFRTGDRVNVTAFAQSCRNHYTCSNRTELWGVTIWPAPIVKGKTFKPRNNVSLAGKVTSTFQTTNKTTLATLYVVSTKELISYSGTKVEKQFYTYMTVALNNKLLEDKSIDKGDWLSIRGFVVKSRDKSGQNDMHIVATRIEEYEHA